MIFVMVKSGGNALLIPSRCDYTSEVGANASRNLSVPLN